MFACDFRIWGQKVCTSCLIILKGINLEIHILWFVLGIFFLLLFSHFCDPYIANHTLFLDLFLAFLKNLVFLTWGCILEICLIFEILKRVRLRASKLATIYSVCLLWPIHYPQGLIHGVLRSVLFWWSFLMWGQISARNSTVKTSRLLMKRLLERSLSISSLNFDHFLSFKFWH